MALVATTITLGQNAILPVAWIYPCLIGSRCIFALLGSGTGPASQAYVADRTDDRGAHGRRRVPERGDGARRDHRTGRRLDAGGLRSRDTDLLRGRARRGERGSAGSDAARGEGAARDRARAGQAAAAARPARAAVSRHRGRALQAVRATVAITLALFFQDTLGLDAADGRARRRHRFRRSRGVRPVRAARRSCSACTRARARCSTPVCRSRSSRSRRSWAAVARDVRLRARRAGDRPQAGPAGHIGRRIGVGRRRRAGRGRGRHGRTRRRSATSSAPIATTLYQLDHRAPYLLCLTVMTAALAIVVASPRIRRLRA